MSEEVLQKTEKRREAKGKGEKERCTHLNAELQRTSRRDKKVFPSDQCKEIQETLPGSSPSRIQGNPQDERHRRMRERVRQSSGLSLKFIFALPLYTLNNIFGGSAYCLHTGHLKTLQQLDLQQKQDVTHILFHSQESFLSFGLQAC